MNPPLLKNNNTTNGTSTILTQNDTNGTMPGPLGPGGEIAKE
ncbi:MAG: hypothetical protein WCF06_00075 [Nitrososphaeraceae archaeon]